MEDYADQMQRCRDYVEALQEERRKIQVFHRELPLCIELVTQAIDACRQQLGNAGRTEYFPGRSDSSEQTSSEEGPVLEEFIPLKRCLSSSSSEEESEHNPESKDRNDKSLKKIDWLRSVQLWNTNPDPSPKQVQDQTERNASVIETDKIGGAFHPFQRSVSTIPSSGQKISVSSTITTTTTTTTTTDAEGNGGLSDNNEGGGSGKREEKEGQSQRKPRRSWSPELHRRFLNALQQLGGSLAATPKQIRELMKVDGLTNDEVKSHLQKYRLHTRRPSPAGIPNGNNLQQPQFVVVEGIWAPPPEYAAAAASTVKGEMNGVAANRVYAPVASLPHPPPPATVKQSQRSPSHLEDRGSQSGDEKGHSNSPTSSSSTHTTTASAAL